jgi:hypothetical protein
MKVHRPAAGDSFALAIAVAAPTASRRCHCDRPAAFPALHKTRSSDFRMDSASTGWLLPGVQFSILFGAGQVIIDAGPA